MKRFPPSCIKEKFTTKAHEMLYMYMHKQNVLKQSYILHCALNSVNGKFIDFVSL